MRTMACPHCGVVAHFSHQKTYELGHYDDIQVSLVSCDHCNMPVAGLWRPSPDNVGTDFFRHWPLSVPVEGFDDVPAHIAEVAVEAHRCVAAQAPRAAVAVARAAVEAIGKDKGITTGGLDKKINDLQAAGHISEAMKEAADEIRFAGNEAAHGDIVHEPISQADAEEIVALLGAILERVYQEPARVARVRARRQERKDVGAAQRDNDPTASLIGT